MSRDAQTSSCVILVRPAAFGFHPEAAATNAFASSSADAGIRAHAMREADRLAGRLDQAGVQVLMLEDSPHPQKPDAVFPNNWVSFHADGAMVLYPMATERRRLERDSLAVTQLVRDAGFAVVRTVDLSQQELDGRFLEGTGSLVLDRPSRRAFAASSPRTDAEVVAQFDAQLGYSTLLFDARDRSGKPIYHTNVLMSLGTRFGVLCSEAVAEKDRKRLAAEIQRSGRVLIDIDYEQMRRFACNLLELRSIAGHPIIALSSTALKSLREDQMRALERHGELVDTDIPTIESVGGGSVRCMIAEVHLPRA